MENLENVENVEEIVEEVETVEEVVEETVEEVETVEEDVEEAEDVACRACGSKNMENKSTNAKVDLAEAVIAGVYMTDVTLVFNNVLALTCLDCGSAKVLNSKKEKEIADFLNQLTHNEQ